MFIPEGRVGFVHDGNFYLTTHSDADPCPKGGLFDGSNCWVYRMPQDHFGAWENGTFVLDPVCDRVPYFEGTGH